MKEPYIIAGGIAVDDRGSLRFANDFDFSDVKRFYQVRNHRVGFIRAWHGHERESKYVWVASGSALVAVVPMGTQKGDLSKVQKFVLSEQQPKVLYIPNGYYNGFMNLEEGTRIQFFSTSTLEESVGDDIRQEYNYWDIWNESFR